MDYAEDDPHDGYESAAAVHKPDYAVDDAPYVRFFHPEFPGGAGALLDRLKYRGNRGSGIHYRLGTTSIGSHLSEGP